MLLDEDVVVLVVVVVVSHSASSGVRQSGRSELQSGSFGSFGSQQQALYWGSILSALRSLNVHRALTARHDAFRHERWQIGSATKSPSQALAQRL